MDDDQIKVHYIPKAYVHLRGAIFQSSAYVSEATLIGTDKHTDAPVRLAWSDDHNTYIELENDELTIE